MITRSCPAGVLTHVYNALEDGGFLLFFEITCVLPTLLWGLDAQCWNFSDEREFGLWVGRAQWERLLQDVGFTKVGRFWHLLPPLAPFEPGEEPTVASVRPLFPCGSE